MRFTSSASKCMLDSLVVEVLELHLLCSNYVRLALAVFDLLALLARLVSLSSFDSYSMTHGQSESKISFDAEPVGFTRFLPFQLLRRRKIARRFLVVLS